MAAKLLHSLADENPDLQKQIGCMTGIFQIFDRQQLISGKRLNQRRILPPPSGNSKCSNGSLDFSRESYNRELLERNSNKYVNEKQQRASTESSRASFSSSSRSSSFSSLDCGRACEPEPSCLDRMIFPETPSRDPGISHTSSSPKMGRLSFDLRDVVKNSMYKDSRGLSVQKTVKDERSDYTSIHKDSPRSLGTDIKESLRVLAKLRDAPWYYYENELSNFSSESKEGHRFSYDGREINRKIKDLPRLSLDSRESSSRISIVDAKLTRLSETAPQPSRSSSVVAKLMGLDTLPNAKPSNENLLGPIKTYIIEDRIPSCRPVRLPKSPKSSRKDPTSPKWRNVDGVMKPLSSAKCPLEPAPWKHMDASRASPKQVKPSASTSITFPSVYGEMEKQFKDIEFKQSGKDLRALKQILKAMREKGILEQTVNNRSEDQKQVNSNNSRTSRVSPSKASESPIVIMRPANKLVQKSGIPSSSDKRANNRNVRATQASSSRPPQQVAKDTATSSTKASGSISPRLQQKKLEFDRRARPPTPPPPPDSSKTRRQPINRQLSENSTPGGRRRPKTSPVTQNEDKSSEKRNPKSLSCQESNTSGQSDPNSALENRESPMMESLKCSLPKQMDDVRLGFTEKKTGGDNSVAREQPSPVSVLDSCSYMEGSPSPVKQTIHTALQGDPIPETDGNPGKDLWNTNELSTATTVPEISSEISREKLQSIDNLVQKLRRLNSNHDETQTDYIALLCENSNPDHRYISEILLASGLLLRDLTFFQLHPSGHPINPELFFVLEQTKTSSLNCVSLWKTKPEKFHRKLIFDSVNEILTGKLNLVGPWASPAKKTLNAQKLLKELCAEIEILQDNKHGLSVEEEEDGLKNILWEDVMRRSGNWAEFPGEVSSIVLDVERHIFKELVDDIVMGESAERIRAKPNRRYRQLFSK